jgi:HAD superfamily hydrolase (TIGR01549 family)
MSTPRAHLDGRPVDAVLIDAGGVLVDPNWSVVSDVLARHGVPVEPATLAAAEPIAKRRWDDEDAVRATSDLVRRDRFLAQILRLAAVDFDADEVEAATDEVEAIHQQRGIWEIVVEGVPEALDALRAAGLKLSLASNSEPLLRHKLAELDLAHHFDHLAISGEIGIEKPDPRIFQSALEAIGVPPERAIHVGDFYEIDVVGARNAGLEAVMVDVADLSAGRAVRRIRSLSELPRLLGLRPVR